MPLFIFIALFLCFPTKIYAQNFGAQTHTLKNGLQIVVIPNNRVPIITHMIWYKVGSADEQVGQSGMAHYLEHLMFKGTDTLKPGEFSRRVKEMGGNDNAFTSYDYTAYYQTIPVQQLESVMIMEADRMQNLKVLPQDFQSEKNVVIEERKQRVDNTPLSRLSEQLTHILYANHPYAIPVIGWMHEIESYEWDDVRKFYDIWYAPNNAVVVISGNITMDKLLPMAEKIYGVIPSKTLPERARPQIAPAIASPTLTLVHDQIKEPAFIIKLLAPSYNQDKKDALALTVLQQILGGDSTSRLYQSLVVQQKKAVDISMHYRSGAINHGSITIMATPKEGIETPKMRSYIQKELDDIIQNGVTETERQKAIEQLQNEQIFARDSISAPALIFGRALTTGSSIQDIENWTKDLETVTKTDIMRVAKKYLDLNNGWIRSAVFGIPTPNKKEKKEE